MSYPISPSEEIDGMLYFPRLCNKIRLHQAGDLHEDFHENLGKGMDLWTCQFLEIDYSGLDKIVRDGGSDDLALAWARENGKKPTDLELSWWNSYMRNRGFRDDLSAKLQFRIKEGGFEDLGIQTFFDYLDADVGR